MHGKKAIVVTVPFPQLRAFQRLHAKLTRELEKKYSGKVVVFIAKVRCRNKWHKWHCSLIVYQTPHTQRCYNCVAYMLYTDTPKLMLPINRLPKPIIYITYSIWGVPQISFV